MSLFVLISITVVWLLASVHRGKRGLRRGRPGREALLMQCRSRADFLWSWRMPVAAELPSRPEEVSEGEGNGRSVPY